MLRRGRAAPQRSRFPIRAQALPGDRRSLNSGTAGPAPGDEVSDRLHAADEAFAKSAVAELRGDDVIDDALRVLGPNHRSKAAAEFDVNGTIVHRHEDQHAVVVP